MDGQMGIFIKEICLWLVYVHCREATHCRTKAVISGIFLLPCVVSQIMKSYDYFEILPGEPGLNQPAFSCFTDMSHLAYLLFLYLEE